MAVSNPLQGHPDGAELRKKAGAWLKGLREAVPLTQQELSKIVGFDYYTTVSQIERGLARLPPDRQKAYADALNQKTKPFVMRLMMYYDPHTWELLNKPDEE